jgi:hypothetical protein
MQQQLAEEPSRAFLQPEVFFVKMTPRLVSMELLQAPLGRFMSWTV